MALVWTIVANVLKGSTNRKFIQEHAVVLQAPAPTNATTRRMKWLLIQSACAQKHGPMSSSIVKLFCGKILKLWNVLGCIELSPVPNSLATLVCSDIGAWRNFFHYQCIPGPTNARFWSTDTTFRSEIDSYHPFPPNLRMPANDEPLVVSNDHKGL